MAKTLKWANQDLHLLYQRRLDPKVRNFSALVWYHCKVKNKSDAKAKVADASWHCNH